MACIKKEVTGTPTHRAARAVAVATVARPANVTAVSAFRVFQQEPTPLTRRLRERVSEPPIAAANRAQLKDCEYAHHGYLSFWFPFFFFSFLN